MKEVETKEMECITGGSSALSPLINAITKVVSTIYDLGRETGSAIRRLVNGSYCSVR